MLTRKQREILVLIIDQVETTGIAPSVSEITAELDLRSKSGVHRLLTALEERGFIRRLPNRARAITVLKLPDGRQFASPLTSQDRIALSADASRRVRTLADRAGTSPDAFLAAAIDAAAERARP